MTKPVGWVMLIGVLIMAVLAAGVGVLLVMNHAANGGQIEQTIYAAKTQSSLWLLEDSLEGRAYLNPDEYAAIAQKANGDIIALAPHTPVYCEGAFSRQGHKLTPPRASDRVLQIKVEAGPLKGVVVLVPEQYCRYVVLAGRNASL